MPFDNFIQLNRTFSELSEKSGNNDDEEISGSFTGTQFDWDSLIKEYRVIILSEAGSGKTAEIRNAARTLREQGKAAFFLRLEHIRTDFEDAFEVGAFNDFNNWIESSEEGWLLLDSVDEARLRDPRDFELAIRKLKKHIQKTLDRTHIVITSRISAWRPKTDRDLCNLQLPFAGEFFKKCVSKSNNTENTFDNPCQTEKQTNNSDIKLFRIFALNDLKAYQITLFVKSKGIEDSKAFLDEVERADAWQFTSRPQDLEELTDFWNDNGRIGSRYEIIRNSIDRRLAERDQNRKEIHTLTKDRAHLGAKLIAAATTLAKVSKITVPDGTDNSKGLAVQSVLPDWSGAEQSILLLRPIFDEAIYGTVRFHHRSVREYLAAEWFAELLKRETSRRNIEALFFRSQYGKDIVTPTLRPILPWLVLMDEKIRTRVRKIAPEIFFEGGDPVQLPVDYRREILREACEQMADGVTGRSAKSYQAVQRFASQDLCDVIRELIHKYVDNDVLTEYLLRMAWFGKIDGLLPEAMHVALMPNAEKYARLSAFRAVQAIGSENAQKLVRQSFLAEAEQLNREYLAELLKEVKPTEETWDWLFACIKRSEQKKTYEYSDHLPEAITQFVDAADNELLQKIITGLNELLDQSPLISDEYCEVSKSFEWLISSAANAVERLIIIRHSEALNSDILSILRKISALRMHGFGKVDISEYKKRLLTLLSEWPELNRSLFWFEVQQKRKSIDQKSGNRLTDFWEAGAWRSLWKFEASDFEYVTGEIANQSFLDDKMVALSLAFDLYKKARRPRAWRIRLHKFTSGNTELAEQLKNYLKPPAQSKESRQWKRKQAKWKMRSEDEKKKKEQLLVDSKKFFENNIDKIRAAVREKPGEIINPLLWLFKQTQKQNKTSRWTDYNWKILIAQYGVDIAELYRDWAVSLWRKHELILHSEGAPFTETPWIAVIGLVGLEIEAHETDGWPMYLDESEVERACRYASFELNGFPVWFQGLFEIYPEIVGKFLLKEIKFELSIENPESDTSYIISDLYWHEQWAWNQLAQHIYDILKNADPKNISNFEKLLKILQGSNYSGELIAELACDKCKSIDDLRHLARWYAIWTCVDPEKAIPSFSSHIEKIANPKEQTSFAMIFVTHLFIGRVAERRGEKQYKRDKFKNPANLKTLYLLMHEYIRREEDINRFAEAVCYTPELRDEAQDAREALLNALKAISGKETYMALVEIAQKHHDKSDRPWIMLDAKTLAEQDGDLEPWTPMQIREFYNDQERSPSNHKELAELAILRLLDLKDDLEEGDSSIASILNPIQKETEIRKYIGHVLREKAHGRYSIPQEEEYADAKRADLRFHGFGFDAPVPVEIKLADKWTGPDLFERLENQLCGDYLRDKRSGRGIYLLVYRGQSQHWQVPGKDERLNFDELVAALQHHWAQISVRFPNIEDITVIGIDLTKRSR